MIQIFSMEYPFVLLLPLPPFFHAVAVWWELFRQKSQNDE